MESSALWRRLIVAKYGSSHSDTKAETSSLKVAQGPWKAISLLQQMVDQHVAVTVGNGHLVAFWHGIWVNYAFLHIAFPNLFASSFAKEATVFDP